MSNAKSLDEQLKELLDKHIQHVLKRHKPKHNKTQRWFRLEPEVLEALEPWLPMLYERFCIEQRPDGTYNMAHLFMYIIHNALYDIRNLRKISAKEILGRLER